METTLVNLHYYKNRDVVYIDRRNRLLGNRHRIGLNCTRKQAVERFRKDFNKRIKKNRKFRKAVENLKGKKIACWCTPLFCHGDIYIKYLRNIKTYLEALH